MDRIDENTAAKEFAEKLKNGGYPSGYTRPPVTYSKLSDEDEIEAVREFMKSKLFEEFKGKV